jgi:hypothetical protein
MIKKIFRCILIFITLSLPVGAQEFLRPLDHNPQKTESNFQFKNSFSGSLTLPFFEDFSNQGPFPDQRLWSDRYVFVNSSFAIHPKTNGVATFDAIDQYGKIYKAAEETSYSFPADFLTSQPIRLDSVFSPTPKALVPSDSIFLTFYYQPQGTGSAPRQKDSLVVEFLHTPGHYAPDPENNNASVWIEDRWVSIWRAEGESFASFEKQHGNFKRVAIPITNTTYLRSDFKFRFRNYASFPLTKSNDNYGGNISIWNIDYITLDHGRKAKDSYYADIAFAAPAQSLLKDYQAVPWSHYIAKPQLYNKSRLNVLITNLDNTIYNYQYRWFVLDEKNNNVRNYSGGTWNIAPYSTSGYQTYEIHANPEIPPLPFGNNLSPATSREFRIYHAIEERGTSDTKSRNDTTMFRQIFDNYFAYDDGVPENGYGLSGFNAKGAVRFVLGKKDNLDAVQFYFNPTLNNRNNKTFRIKIWKNLHPEQVIYESPVLSVEHGPWRNQYVSYPLSQAIEVSDTIYVGWQQLSNDFLHIGFDASGNASSHIFYNVDGNWQQTIYNGALMIRPVFGPQNITTVQTPALPDNNKLNIFPNPVRHNILNIESTESFLHGSQIIIIDISGKIVARYQPQHTLDVSSLKNGIYFLQIRNEEGQQLKTSRFILAR